MDKLIARFLLTKLLLALWLVVTFPVWFSGRLLLRYLESHNEPNELVWALRFTGVSLFVGFYWLSKKMAHHMTVEGQGFSNGVKSGFYDLRLHLAFLPLAGCWFTPKLGVGDDGGEQHSNEAGQRPACLLATCRDSQNPITRFTGPP